MKRTRIALLVLPGILVALALTAPSALARIVWDEPCEPACDVLVDTTVDEPDAVIGDGVCATAAGECSLRAAVQESNASAGSKPPYYVRIVLPPGTYVLTRHGAGENDSATGDLDLKFAGAVIGSGVGKTIVDGDRADRVFTLNEYGAELANMTVRNGRVVGPGGGILARAQVLLNHLEVTGSEAIDGPDTADPPPSDHLGNSVAGRGGGVDAHDTSLGNVWIHHNTADYGGGLQWHGQQAGFGTVTLDHNHARKGGGGLRYDGFDASFGLLTVTHNTAGERGGGIEADMTASYWSTVVGGLTVADNSAPAAGGIWLSPHTMGDDDGERIHSGLLVVENAGGDCGGPGTLPAAHSRGGNLDSDGTCGFTGPNDGSNVEAKLGPLQDNGGYTPTRALLPGSDAIDAWPCTSTGRDQRGATRPSGAACDSGAFELGGACCAVVDLPTFEAPKKPPKDNQPGPNPPGPPNQPPGPNPPGPSPPGPDPAKPGPCGFRVLGTAKADKLHGDELRNEIAGRAGGDTILGLGGDDCLFGNAGNDVLKGGPGADRLEGGSGSDRVVGGDGNDSVKAGPGNDVVDARGKGFDRIDCGPGRDKALVGDLDRVRNCERVLNVD